MSAFDIPRFDTPETIIEFRKEKLGKLLSLLNYSSGNHELIITEFLSNNFVMNLFQRRLALQKGLSTSNENKSWNQSMNDSASLSMSLRQLDFEIFNFMPQILKVLLPGRDLAGLEFFFRNANLGVRNLIFTTIISIISGYDSIPSNSWDEPNKSLDRLIELTAIALTE